MAKRTTDNTETRLLAMLLKTADVETLRQCVQGYAEKDAAFGAYALKCLSKSALPESVTPEAYRETVQGIFGAECVKYGHRYSYEGKDWVKIGAEMETLFDIFALNLEGEEGLCAGAAVLEFYRLIVEEGDGDMDDEGVYDLSVVAEKGKAILLTLLQDEGTPKPWKRAVVSELDKLSASDDWGAFDYLPLDIVEEAPLYALTQAELEQRLDAQIAAASEYQLAGLLLKKCDMLRKTERSAEAVELMNRHLDLADIRRRRVEELMAEGQYEEGMALIEAAMTPDPRGNGMWLDLQSRYAAKHGDKPRAISADRRLFLMAGGSVPYYRQLKKRVPAEEWGDFVKQLIADARRERWANAASLAEICIAEGFFRQVDEMLPQHLEPSLDYICRFAPKVPEPNTLIMAFAAAARRYAQQMVGRDYYVQLGKWLKKIRSTKGGQDVVDALVAEFRATYRRRSAMMQELDKCGL